MASERTAFSGADLHCGAARSIRACQRHLTCCRDCFVAKSSVRAIHMDHSTLILATLMARST